MGRPLTCVLPNAVSRQESWWGPVVRIVAGSSLLQGDGVEWFEQAQAAERREDWNTAIALVSAHAECFSADYNRHDSHLWHMDLLVRAGRLSELAARASTDVHARRRLNRSLRERGMEAALSDRARDGDRHALYVLVQLLCETGRVQEARQVVEDFGPDNQYAQEIVAGFRSPSSDAQ